jgi:hypothetical protein
VASAATKNQDIREFCRRFVRVMKVKDGDVILVQKDEGNINIFNGLRRAMAASDRRNCILVYVNELSDINTLSEAEMKEWGWIRDPEWGAA